MYIPKSLNGLYREGDTFVKLVIRELYNNNNIEDKPLRHEIINYPANWKIDEYASSYSLPDDLELGYWISTIKFIHDCRRVGSSRDILELGLSDPAIGSVYTNPILAKTRQIRIEEKVFSRLGINTRSTKSNKYTFNRKYPTAIHKSCENIFQEYITTRMELDIRKLCFDNERIPSKYIMFKRGELLYPALEIYIEFTNKIGKQRIDLDDLYYDIVKGYTFDKKYTNPYVYTNSVVDPIVGAGGFKVTAGMVFKIIEMFIKYSKDCRYKKNSVDHKDYDYESIVNEFNEYCDRNNLIAPKRSAGFYPQKYRFKENFMKRYEIYIKSYCKKKDLDYKRAFSREDEKTLHRYLSEVFRSPKIKLIQNIYFSGNNKKKFYKNKRSKKGVFPISYYKYKSITTRLQNEFNYKGLLTDKDFKNPKMYCVRYNGSWRTPFTVDCDIPEVREMLLEDVLFRKLKKNEKEKLVFNRTVEPGSIYSHAEHQLVPNHMLHKGETRGGLDTETFVNIITNYL